MTTEEKKDKIIGFLDHCSMQQFDPNTNDWGPQYVPMEKWEKVADLILGILN